MKNYIWVKIYLPIWSFFINFFYWLFHFPVIFHVWAEKKELKKSIKTVRDISNLLKYFKWKADKFMDWKPWIITLIAREYNGDCDDAAVLAKFLFKQIGIKGKVWSLFGETGHAVFVSNDRKFMTSNGSVHEGLWTEIAVLNHFRDKYSEVIK